MYVHCPDCNKRTHVQQGGLPPRLFSENGVMKADNLPQGVIFKDKKFYRQCWECKTQLAKPPGNLCDDSCGNALKEEQI